MAYIGTNPANTGTGLFSQDTFTGDGSTVAFDLTNAAPDGGGNELQVFVDNVRQQEGSSNAYTLGFDGSSELKRITFTAAPAASASIFVLNPGTKNVQQISTVSDNAVTTAKVQDDAITTAKILDSNITTAKITDLNVTTAKIAADAINATKIADDSISEEHLDVTAITGNVELATTSADDDVLLVYDTSAGTIKKIQRSNVALANPTFSSVSPTSLTSGDGTGNHTIVVTGTKFDTGATFSLITDGGTTITMDSVVRNSSSQLTGTVAKNKANLTNANEPFDVKITNGSALSVTSTNQINIDASPVYVTAAGTLGTLTGGSAMSTTDIVASDPESAGNVTFEIQSGSLPAGVATATVNENGVSKFRITGTPTNPGANTTSNFVLRAVDAASNTTSRAFSITVNRTYSYQSFTSSGTFSVPSGVATVDVLVVGGGGSGGEPNGGGGGAGGLIFMPEFPVTPSGTVSVTVGDGGAEQTAQQPGNVGQDSVFGTLTAKGGGAGGGQPTGGPVSVGEAGGSGGGGGGGESSAPGPNPGGTATQPTQPGNSGAYGFGNAGGYGYCFGSARRAGGGGGGAAAVGTDGGGGGGYICAGVGGNGKAYTIADGTTPVTYAGGGGGGVQNDPGGVNNSYSPGQAPGGTGGGGAGSFRANGQIPGTSGTAGQANKGGGGGGGASNTPATGGHAGGKGIVIVKY